MGIGATAWFPSKTLADRGRKKLSKKPRAPVTPKQALGMPYSTTRFVAWNEPMTTSTR